MPDQNSVGCSPTVKEKIKILREAMHNVVTDPEVLQNRDCAAEVKSHIARNLGILNQKHNFRVHLAPVTTARHLKKPKTD